MAPSSGGAGGFKLRLNKQLQKMQLALMGPIRLGWTGIVCRGENGRQRPTSEMLGARDVRRQADTLVSRTKAHGAMARKTERRDGDGVGGNQTFNSFEQFERNRGREKALPRSSLQLGAGEDRGVTGPSQFLRSHRGRMLYGQEGLLASSARTLPPWAALMWRRGCCFGLLGGSNQCGVANMFFEDLSTPAGRMIQDDGITLPDQGERDMPAAFQCQIRDCDEPGNDENFFPGVHDDGWEDFAAEQCAGGQVCGGEAAYSMNFADHRFHSEESILRLDGAGQGPHLCSELAGRQVVTRQDCAAGEPCVAQPPRTPPKGVQQEHLECSVSAGSQDVPFQDFAGAPFSARLLQVQPKALQHDLVDHRGFANSQVNPFQESLSGMQRGSLDCSACGDSQELTPQDLASGCQAPAQGMQHEFAWSSLFGEEPWIRQDCTTIGLVQSNFQEVGSVSLIHRFDLEHDDWQLPSGLPQGPDPDAVSQCPSPDPLGFCTPRPYLPAVQGHPSTTPLGFSFPNPNLQETPLNRYREQVPVGGSMPGCPNPRLGFSPLFPPGSCLGFRPRCPSHLVEAGGPVKCEPGARDEVCHVQTGNVKPGYPNPSSFGFRPPSPGLPCDGATPFLGEPSPCCLDGIVHDHVCQTSHSSPERGEPTRSGNNCQLGACQPHCHLPFHLPSTRDRNAVGGEEWPYSPDISTASCPGLCNVNFNCDSSRIHTCHFGPKAGGKEWRDCPETSTALDHHRTCGALSRVKADDFVSDFGSRPASPRVLPVGVGPAALPVPRFGGAPDGAGNVFDGLKESLRPMIMQLVQEAIKEALAAALGTSPACVLTPPADNAPVAEPKPKRQRNGKGKGGSAPGPQANAEQSATGKGASGKDGASSRKRTAPTEAKVGGVTPPSLESSKPRLGRLEPQVLSLRRLSLNKNGSRLAAALNPRLRSRLCCEPRIGTPPSLSGPRLGQPLMLWRPMRLSIVWSWLNLSKLKLCAPSLPAPPRSTRSCLSSSIRMAKPGFRGESVTSCNSVRAPLPRSTPPRRSVRNRLACPLLVLPSSL